MRPQPFVIFYFSESLAGFNSSFLGFLFGKSGIVFSIPILVSYYFPVNCCSAFNSIFEQFLSVLFLFF